MSSPWAASGTRYRDDLDTLQLLLAGALAEARSAGREPHTDPLCLQRGRELRRATRALLARIFTADGIFFADVPSATRWVGGPSRNVLQSIRALADPCCAATFEYLPCLPCLVTLFSAPRIAPHALDDCRRTDHVHNCPACSRESRICQRLARSVSTEVIDTLTMAFRSELGGSHVALPMPFRSEVGTSDQARRLLILAMYSEHRRASWAEYLRYRPGTGAEPVPQPGSDIKMLIAEQESREPQRVEEISGQYP